MVQKATGQEILENAYKLNTPADNVAYYRQFAPYYDTDFVEQMGYQYPKVVAEAYRRLATEADVPIADIGCGTGLVAVELAMPSSPIDGMDISREMLGIAKERKLYRELHEVDLTAPLAMFAGTYGAVLSAGTFTHGHLGPGSLRGLLEIGRTGALFIIGVNKLHFEKEGFDEVLSSLTRGGQIGEIQIDEVSIYFKSGHEHAGDHAMLLQYRRK